MQSLNRLGRLADVKVNVRSTLDKLKGIKADLVRGSKGRLNWGLINVLTKLKRWTYIDPVEDNVTEKSSGKGDSL